MIQAESLPPMSDRRRVFPAACWVPIAETRESICYHEAGHAALAQMLLLPCHSATVTQESGAFWMLSDNGGYGATSVDSHEQAEIMLLAGRVKMPESLPEDLVIDIATMLAAGVQAQLLQAGIKPAGALYIADQDTRQARYLLAEYSPTTSLGYCQIRARSILTQHWSEVAMMACTLFETGRWSALT